MNELITISNLTKKYGRFTALNQINLTLPKGKIIGLLGPNGSGKSTLIKLMNGLLTPTDGEIRILGNTPGPETKAVVSYLPERTYLPDNIRLSELIAFFEDFYADFNPQKAMAMIEALNIPMNARLSTLSKGTKEKVQLIMVMSREASLYILDEPIAGVDPAARDYILRTIIQDYNEDATILLSTHLITDIENILDDVLFLKNGHLVLSSSVEDVRNRYGKSVDAYFREVFAC